MLASLAQFIPSALHIGANDHNSQTSPTSATSDSSRPSALNYTTDDDEESAVKAIDRSSHADEMGVRKKELKKNPVENFIIVRPPPSMSNHPLNLQVQLLPPHSRPPTGLVASSRMSTDSTHTVSQPTPTPGNPPPDSQGGPLERTSSNRSTASTTSTSGYGSTSSFSSVASTSSSASSARRAIVPLYNLQAHNVMTNTIVDAGTDAKIAKCRSKGLELIDLAFLEPVEVWGDPLTGLPLTGAPSAKAPSDENYPARSSAFSQRLFSGGANSRPVTPDVHPHSPATSSAISVNSVNPGQPLAPPLAQPTPPQSVISSSSQAAPTKRNFFNKMFKKSPKDAGQNSSNISQASSHKRTPSVPGGGTSQPISGLPATSAGHARNLSAQLQGLGIGKRRSFSPMPNARDGGAGATNGNGNGHHNHDFNGDAVGGDPSLLHPNANPASWTPSAHGQNGSSSSTGPPNNSSSANPTPTNSAIVGQQQQQQQQSQKDQAALIRPPVLGIQPTLSAPLPNPLPKYARALMYVWFLRRWTKKSTSASNFTFSLSGDGEGGGGGSGIFGGVLRVGGGEKGGSNLIGSAQGQVEVRFEWRRSGAGKKKVAAAIAAAVAADERGEGSTSSRGRGGKKKKGDNDATNQAQEQGVRASGSNPSLNRSSTVSDGDSPQQGQEQGKSRSPGPRDGEKKKKKRRSWLTKDGADVVDGEGENGGGADEGEKEKDDGDESDPEDSETPWVCTLKLRKIGNWTYPAAPATGGGSGPDKQHDTSASTSTSTLEHPQQPSQPPPPRPPQPPNVVKLKVATLSPTPHHPKVIAMLKVPFPLPDVEVETLTVVPRKRKKTATGEDKPPYVFTGTKLSAEEIKDIVSSTGLWLVVRESFGGLGKIPRKGDGWRIRP